ncbi:MAG: TonB-dependent receptor, partial [Bacteroidota bacterium]
MVQQSANQLKRMEKYTLLNLTRIRLGFGNWWWISCLMLLLSTGSKAQGDSLLLQFDRLGRGDIALNPALAEQQRVVSASRTLKTVEELPFTIYVVTKEEIFRNGYTTLVDVLKSVPGIKVSQPGSALEGETFLMRGLLGNAYTKILVNDMEVKPSVVSGMPIGAQLPVKQAERIEIIFGPAAAIYGADASAGVINIITREIEKPLYAQSDLSVGSDAYTHLNVMFGGKIGRNKNILKFTVFGSSTEFNNRNTLYDRNTLYNPRTYTNGDTSFLSNDNYRGTANVPRINSLGHQSRSLGIHLKYRSFTLSLDQMSRQDHSSVGLSTRAVSYVNPQNFFGETISKIQLGFNHDFKKVGFVTSINSVFYLLDSRSSYTYVDNNLNRLLKDVVADVVSDPQLRDSINQDNFDRFFSGIRYSYAESWDLNLEQLITYHPNEYFEWVGGVNFRGSYNQPLINYLRNPFREESIFDQNDNINLIEAPLFSADELNYDLGAFTQLYFTTKRWNLITGLRYDNFSRYGTSWNPRFAALYKVNTNLSARASFATAFRVPSPFYSANTYEVNTADFSSFETGNFEIQPERTRSVELGLRWKWRDKLVTDVNFFFSRTNNFISNTVLGPEDSPGGDGTRAIGYFNDGNSAVSLYGWQTRILLQKFIERFPHVNTELNINVTRGQEVLPFEKGTIDRVRLQPIVSGQFK